MQDMNCNQLHRQVFLMRKNILYIMSSFNVYGGTPKKTLDLMKYFGDKSSIYVYHNAYPEFKPLFENTGGKVYEGFYGRNIFKHLIKLLRIIDQEKIDIVQTQFSMGETLGFLIKLFRPRVKLVIAFVGPFKPTSVRSFLASLYYRKTDAFVYISEYVKREKTKQFPILNSKPGKIIYNGTEKRVDDGKQCVQLKKYSVIDIAGLIDWKNIQVLIEAFNIIVNERNVNNIFLYVAGDGSKRPELEASINTYALQEHVFLLGYQSNVGRLLDSCDIFVHPAYAEGFGIVVAEAMHAGKPIIVSNAGALPELIENEKSGLVVDPYDPEQWTEAILRIIEDKEFAQNLAQNAKFTSETKFSVDNYTKQYEQLYESLIFDLERQ